MEKGHPDGSKPVIPLDQQLRIGECALEEDERADLRHASEVHFEFLVIDEAHLVRKPCMSGKSNPTRLRPQVTHIIRSQDWGSPRLHCPSLVLFITLSIGKFAQAFRARAGYSCLIRPSAITYDEWATVSSKESQLVKGLTDVDYSLFNKRPLVSLLSGTPMKQGPQSLRSTFDLVCQADNPQDNLQPAIPTFSPPCHFTKLQSEI
ncbi:hypothetical protein B0I35DRAFT_406142 [Stachybotrys elegans]|uniref:Uncharacterized protein n=1 Tax=Stachybotrys elegans TaxID=80388 RepID=A0A8K0SWZ8_9HYPO|nr:hypothetical protein B0I35DRAFT_406142 [Stachybotrys elegans]